MEQSYVINNGKFTGAGNFSGYTAKGKRIHIFGRQMESIGWATNEDVSFPFYCIAEEKTINAVDADNNPTGETAQRLTALSVFKTEDSLIQAHTDESLLNTKIRKAVKEQAVTAGLSAEEITSLTQALF